MLGTDLTTARDEEEILGLLASFDPSSAAVDMSLRRMLEEIVVEPDGAGLSSEVLKLIREALAWTNGAGNGTIQATRP